MSMSDEVLLAMVADYVWRPPSIEDEPRTMLTDWRVFKVMADFDCAGDSIHFVGIANGRSGRVCSPVQAFDPVTRCAITRSGRIYELIGKPGMSMDASMVWKYWLLDNHSPEHVEVTKDYEPLYTENDDL